MTAKKQVFVLFVVGLLALQSVSTHAQSRADLVVGYAAISVTQVAPWIMKEAGLFEKYNLRADLVYLSASRFAMALQSGDVHIGEDNGPGVVNAAIAGGDSVLIGEASNTFQFYMMVLPEIKNVAELKGKTFGVTRIGSSTEFAARLLLKKFGLQPGTDVTLYQTGGMPESLAALQAGVIHGGFFSSPTDLKARSLGYRELLDTGTFGIPFTNTGIGTTRSFLKNHRDKARQYLMGYVEALHLYFTNKKLAEEVLKKYTRTTDPKMLDITYSQGLKTLQRIPRPSRESIQTVLDVIGETNPKAKNIKAVDLVDTSLFYELESKGFLKKFSGP